MSQQTSRVKQTVEIKAADADWLKYSITLHVSGELSIQEAERQHFLLNPCLFKAPARGVSLELNYSTWAQNNPT